MSKTVAARLKELAIDLPKVAAPVANYVPVARTGDLLVVSGQLPLHADEGLVTGRLGAEVDLETGIRAARLCALNILAHVSEALDGDLDRVVRILRLGGFVACTPDFTDHPKVVNGASDLMVDLFGGAGRHARAAVGCPSLPLNAAVEVDALIQVS